MTKERIAAAAAGIVASVALTGCKPEPSQHFTPGQGHVEPEFIGECVMGDVEVVPVEEHMPPVMMGVAAPADEAPLPDEASELDALAPEVPPATDARVLE